MEYPKDPRPKAILRPLPTPRPAGASQRPLVLSVLALALVGCPSRWRQYYEPGLADELSDMPLLDSDCGDEPRIVEVNDRDYIARTMARGYYPIGFSAFATTWNVDYSALAHFARGVCADRVTVAIGVGDTYQGTLYLPGAPQTTTVSSSYFARGSGGWASGSGTTQVTTPGAAVAVPYSVTEYNYMATFWVKYSAILGVFASVIERRERIRQGLDAGLVVDVVIRDSGAYEADLIEGDIITSCAGRPMKTLGNLNTCELTHAGERVKIGFVRDGAEHEVKVTFGDGTPAFRKMRAELRRAEQDRDEEGEESAE